MFYCFLCGCSLVSFVIVKLYYIRTVHMQFGVCQARISFGVVLIVAKS